MIVIYENNYLNVTKTFQQTILTSWDPGDFPHVYLQAPPTPHCSLHACKYTCGHSPQEAGAHNLLTCILCNDVKFFNDSPFAVKTIYATCIFQHFNLLATTSTSACRLLLFCECDLTIFYNLGLRVFCNDYL